MARIRSAELKGIPLDWAVCSAEGRISQISKAYTWQQMLEQHQGIMLIGGEVFAPSTNWKQCGAILHREVISTFTQCNKAPVAPLTWYARAWGRVLASGPTPLIAGMRCHAVNRLGMFVNIPDALLEAVERIQALPEMAHQVGSPTSLAGLQHTTSIPRG